jgi:hypothetical protein
MTHLLKIKEINLMLARNDRLTPEGLGAAVLHTVHFDVPKHTRRCHDVDPAYGIGR